MWIQKKTEYLINIVNYTNPDKTSQHIFTGFLTVSTAKEK